MGNDPSSPDRVNTFALVSYIPDPLGGFLDHLRRQLVPACQFRSHVTILPPRPIQCPAEVAFSQIQDQAKPFPPFFLNLSQVEIFPKTSVVYLALGEGREQIIEMHSQMNTECLAYQEPFPFHPHITLAQDFPPEKVEQLAELARREWRNFPFERGFEVNTMTFVQKTAANTWVNLAECPMEDHWGKLVAAAETVMAPVVR